MKEKYTTVLAVLFGTFLNLIWEILHSPLYAFAYGGNFTGDKIALSTLGDAIYIGVIIVFVVPKLLKNRNKWLVVPLGIAFAVLWEMLALKLGVWGYNSLMPVIPVLKVGLSPALQLGITSYLAVLLQTYMLRKNRLRGLTSNGELSSPGHFGQHDE